VRKAKWPGNWKYDCQRCGWTFPSEDIRKEWTGLYVCASCWEPKHPQLLIKVRPETAVPAFKNKDSIIEYVLVCDVFSSSGYAGMGEAGCAQAGNDNTPYSILIDLTTNGHE
jgi:DNA-directed RNA polymerase subunit RPC12/RpoP